MSWPQSQPATAQPHPRSIRDRPPSFQNLSHPQSPTSNTLFWARVLGMSWA